MKLSSRDFYREVRAVLAPQMKAAGFTALKGGTAGWQKETQQGLLSLWFQVDKWGWDALWGTRFNLEFSLGEVAGARSPNGRAERFGMLLEGYDDLEEARVLNNAIIARLPGTLEGKLVTQRMKNGDEIVVQGYRAEPPIEVGFDYWLNCYNVEDAQAWARWFAPRLPRYIAIFENGECSMLGAGRRRFNEALGRVQALPAGEKEAKAAILEAYVQEETEPYWKKAGAFWIAEIRERGGKGATL